MVSRLSLGLIGNEDAHVSALLPATVTSRKSRRSVELRESVRDELRHIECRRCGCLPDGRVHSRIFPSLQTSNRLPLVAEDERIDRIAKRAA